MIDHLLLPAAVLRQETHGKSSGCCRPMLPCSTGDRASSLKFFRCISNSSCYPVESVSQLVRQLNSHFFISGLRKCKPLPGIMVIGSTLFIKEVDSQKLTQLKHSSKPCEFIWVVHSGSVRYPTSESRPAHLDLDRKFDFLIRHQKCHFLAHENGHFRQKCPFSCAKKWHFGCRNKNNGHQFLLPTTPKMVYSTSV